jgi:uncharacterized cupredoxin-like copper-binding protein
MGALAGLLGLVIGLLVAACSQATAQEDAARFTITFRYSHFTPAVVTAPAGVPITFSLRNDDPIEHEWIIGAEDVHERHRTGTEPYHDQVPTEVTVPALSSRVTTITFTEPGEYAYVCHLPGHEAYGMRGTLRIVGP